MKFNDWKEGGLEEVKAEVQARRWFRQAEADLAAVVNDINTGNPSYEWACLKRHQVRIKKSIMTYMPFSLH